MLRLTLAAHLLFTHLNLSALSTTALQINMRCFIKRSLKWTIHFILICYIIHLLSSVLHNLAQITMTSQHSNTEVVTVDTHLNALVRRHLDYRWSKHSGFIHRNYVETFGLENHRKHRPIAEVDSVQYISAEDINIVQEYVVSNNCNNATGHIVFLINSKPDHFSHRKAIRNTWANPVELVDEKVIVVFLLGKTIAPGTSQLLSMESVLYGDIILGDFNDTYGNLIFKTLLGFKWVSSYCKTASLVFKTDDDMFINIKNVKNIMPTIQPNTIYGNCFSSGYPHRNPLSKYYVPYRLYPHQYYPAFCLGGALMMQVSTAQQLYLTLHHLPHMGLDDVMCGMLAQKAGISLQNTPGLKFSGFSMNLSQHHLLAVLLSEVKEFYDRDMRKL